MAVTTDDQTAGAPAWFNGSSIRTASDAALGCILAIAGALPIRDAGGLAFGQPPEFAPALFPSAIGVAMLAVGVLLLARAAFVRRPPPAAWGMRNIALVTVAILAFFIFSWNWGLELMLLNFGPPEHAAALVLVLVVLIALACRSHLQAAGLVLLGLLLGAVGLDSITGQLRLTMGLEQLNHGFPTMLVAIGLLIVAEGMIALFSPSLWLATYAWIVPAWRNARIPVAVAIVLRIAAVAIVVAGCHFGLLYGGRAWDVVLVFALAVFGVACKLFGWNRLVLVLACFYSDILEQAVRQTMLMTQGDLAILWHKPIIAGLSAASIAVVLLVLVLAARSSQKRRRAEQAAA